MKKAIKSPLAWLAMLAATSVLAAAPAGVNGKWTGMVGQSEITFEFKAEGEKLTGKLNNAAQAGDVEIQEGKVKGNEISFVVVRNLQGTETKVPWTGKLEGDELKLQRGAVAGNQVADVVAKRVK